MVTAVINTRYIRASSQVPGTFEPEVFTGPTSATASFAAPLSYNPAARTVITPPANGNLSNPFDILPRDATFASFSDATSRKRTRPAGWSNGPQSDIDRYSGQ